jgi:hypothetical protein
MAIRIASGRAVTAWALAPRAQLPATHHNGGRRKNHASCETTNARE